jgi:biotin transport system substrate-specific component
MTVSSTMLASATKEPAALQKTLWILAGVTILSFAAQLSIPMQPVPLTFQSSAVVLMGMIFGARQSAYMVLAYLITGLCGLPVFAEYSAGPQVFAGPTAGYLIGFLPAAYLSGYLIEHGWSRNFFTRFLAAMAGASVIFLLGVTFLTKFTGGWQAAYLLGAAPFLVSEPVKLAVVAAVTSRFKKKS